MKPLRDMSPAERAKSIAAWKLQAKQRQRLDAQQATANAVTR